MSIIPKAIYRIKKKKKLIKISMAFFTELQKKEFYNLYGTTKDPD